MSAFFIITSFFIADTVDAKSKSCDEAKLTSKNLESEITQIHGDFDIKTLLHTMIATRATVDEVCAGNKSEAMQTYLVQVDEYTKKLHNYNERWGWSDLSSFMKAKKEPRPLTADERVVAKYSNVATDSASVE